ncbi:MAG: Cys-tRNA(Pro) deacylase [Erysipelotrichales bacterium]|nr:Cys-tRNA(Pro) deacylase [Erysipelotrichales bacterium]
MRILDKLNIAYKTYTYDNDGTCVDGLTVASMLHQDPEQVFKTLVTTANHNYYVFVVPVAYELDLKKCARAVGEKSVELVHVKDLVTITGYVRGGCSPIGMRKEFTTTFHETAEIFDTIIFSGGKIGLQLEVSVNDLRSFPKFQFADIVKE